MVVLVCDRTLSGDEIRTASVTYGSSRASGDPREQSFSPPARRASASWYSRELVVPAKTGPSGCGIPCRKPDVGYRVPRGPSAALRNQHILLVARSERLEYNYVMRSTRHVASPNNDQLGHYSDPPLLVLASLAGGPKHGHAMIEDIASLCGTRLGPGTLYGAIARLEQQGWIEPLPVEERRRPYRITKQGARVLHAKLSILRQFSTAGIRRLEAI